MQESLGSYLKVCCGSCEPPEGIAVLNLVAFCQIYLDMPTQHGNNLHGVWHSLQVKKVF